MVAQHPERLDHLLVGLAEADHEAGLGHDVVAAHRLGVAQHAQRALPARAATRDRVQARRDLDVVVEDVGALGDDLGQRHLLAAEVGGQDLDLALGRLAADLADDADEGAGAVVGQVVAVDARDDGVAQPHPRDAARHARGLERVVPRRLAGLDVAEAAAARAGVAEDHEGGRAAIPAVADVGAGGLLADRVQVLGLDARAQLAVARAAGCGDLEPRGLAIAQAVDLAAEHLQHVHPARIGARSRLVLARAHGLGRYNSGRRAPCHRTAPAADRPPLHPLSGAAQARDARLRAPALRHRQLPCCATRRSSSSTSPSPARPAPSSPPSRPTSPTSSSTSCPTCARTSSWAATAASSSWSRSRSCAVTPSA